MRAASTALMALLEQTQFYIADLITFALIDGTFLYLTTAEQSIVHNGNTFRADQGRVSVTKMKLTNDLSVDEATLYIYPSPNDANVDGTTLLNRIYQAGFDGCRVTIERAFMATWGDTSAGTIIKFSGRMGQIVTGRSQIEMTLESDLTLLNIQMPRNLYSTGCGHLVFDSGCTLNRASYAVNGVVGAGSSYATIECNLHKAASWFAQGTIVFTSGVNEGVKMTVRDYIPGNGTTVLDQLLLINPLLDLCQTGDTFTAYPGCDRTQATCTSKFNNLLHFNGTPFIPTAETAA